MESAPMAKWESVASINQTGAAIRLPNFCNLGVMLRSLVIVNLLVAAAAAVRSVSVAAFPFEFLALAGFAEPVLLASLVVLCASRRWLHAIGYVPSLIVLALFEVAATWAVTQALGDLIPDRRATSFFRIAFVALFATGCTLAYFDLRARALTPALAEARIQALQARIRPHFLYNSINAVLGLMRSEPRRAERALEDMADLFRVLMADNRTLAPIADEVELTRQYLAIETLRLGDRLRVAWKLDRMPADALVPPLILQPLVENAVYHGIEPTERGGEIAIEVAREGAELAVRLTNPYPGEGRHAAGNKMAVANIRERLQLHFDAEASMKSEVRDGVYTTVIRVPYITATAP
jgi:two-component system, LytTR family, sensor histidine kinase AlgZ